MKTLIKLWWLTLLRGIVLLVLAFYVFAQPVSALISIAIYIGISLLFTGISQAIMSVVSRDSNERWQWGLAGGLIEALFAIILLSNPGITAASLSFIVGFWIIVFGVMTFVNAFESRKAGVSNWALGLLSGLISILIGFVISNNLLVGSIAITIWIGIGFLVAGIVSISMALAIRSLKPH